MISKLAKICSWISYGFHPDCCVAISETNINQFEKLHSGLKLTLCILFVPPKPTGELEVLCCLPTLFLSLSLSATSDNEREDGGGDSLTVADSQRGGRSVDGDGRLVMSGPMRPLRGLIGSGQGSGRGGFGRWGQKVNV